MKFSLSELMAKITGLEARAEATFKQEFVELKATVSGVLTQAQADLATAQASILSLTNERDTLLSSKTDFEAKITNLSEVNAAINTELSSVCLAANLIDTASLKGADGKPVAADAAADVIQTAALALPVGDKMKLLVNAQHKTIAALGGKTPPAAGGSKPPDNGKKLSATEQCRISNLKK